MLRFDKYEKNHVKECVLSSKIIFRHFFFVIKFIKKKLGLKNLIFKPLGVSL